MTGVSLYVHTMASDFSVTWQCLSERTIVFLLRIKLHALNDYFFKGEKSVPVLKGLNRSPALNFFRPPWQEDAGAFTGRVSRLGRDDEPLAVVWGRLQARRVGGPQRLRQRDLDAADVSEYDVRLLRPVLKRNSVPELSWVACVRSIKYFSNKMTQ
jgi:hypothetical protein